MQSVFVCKASHELKNSYIKSSESHLAIGGGCPILWPRVKVGGWSRCRVGDRVVHGLGQRAAGLRGQPGNADAAVGREGVDVVPANHCLALRLRHAQEREHPDLPGAPSALPCP